MNKYKKIITLVFTVLFVISITLNVIFYRKYVSAIEECSSTYSKEFLVFDSIVPKTFEAKIQRGDTFVALIARPACPDCVELSERMIPYMNKISLNVDFFYVNVETLRKSGTDPQWVEFKKTHGNIDGTPSMLYIKNGEIVSTLSNTEQHLETSEINEWLKDLGLLN